MSRIPGWVRYVAWDSDCECWGYSGVPLLSPYMWETDDLVRNITVGHGMCPFDVWNERHLDLHVEADRLLFESLLKL